MDKDNPPQRSKPDLPNTPRVCGKILEYYKKFGRERDLEKFMRLYSPASSQDSEKNEVNDGGSTKVSTRSPETVSSNTSCEILAIMPSRPLNVCCEANSKSLPNIDIQGKVFGKDLPAVSTGVTVDINIEADGENDKILSVSTDNLRTPKKTFRSTKTQTPESVAKTHRRLEWDSLGDVGYRKSMSTSNISIIERSVLREFFKEKTAVSEASAAGSDEQRIFKNKELKIIEKFIATEKEHSTPPLACSTFVNPTENGTKPKMLSHSTSSTSLTEKFEKYAQTSIIRPPTVRSQEVQCTLSSSYSIGEGTATPSSFEYYSSRSSKSKSSKSSDIILNANTRNRLQSQEHPFITSITDLLMKRKTLGEKNQQNRQQPNNLKDLQTQFQTALDENKENQTQTTADSSSVNSLPLSKQAPELDLGIQLICSLIDAKNINGRQKKELIRDIIKRLTRGEGEEKTDISTTANSSESTENTSGGTTTNSSKFHRQNVYDSVRSGGHKNHQRNAVKSLELGVSPLKTELMNRKEKSTTSSINISGGYKDFLAAEQEKTRAMSTRPQKIQESGRLQQQQMEVTCKHFPVMRNHAENNSTVPNVAATKINKETQSELIMMCEGGEGLEKRCSKSNRCTQTSNRSLTSASTTSTTPDLTTEKLKTNANAVLELNNSNTDADQPTMREWLNPLTQSEIEYEERKEIEVKKKAAAQQQKLMRKAAKDCGRVQQLGWIENEIKRLECLKHLLLKDATATESSTGAASLDNSAHKNSTKNSYQTDKLYDSVFTDKSSVLSESAEQLVQEIEIILEESHEDVINLRDNFKQSKERRKETQIFYDKERNFMEEIETKPKLRVINETSNIREEQLFEHDQAEMDNKRPKQREKIATPDTDVPKGNATLKDMVQQRKREFMEAYKSKKQHHYDALKQQQQQQQKNDFKYLNLPQKLSDKSTTNTDSSEHYSVAQYNTIPRKYTSNEASYYTQQHSSMAVPPIEKEARDKQTSHQQQSSKPQLKETITSKFANVDNSTANSSSSMFCMSSEISVPMGSQNTSSSSAHLYNGPVAASMAAKTGVAVQTSDSIRLTKPIYGPAAPLHPTLIPHNPTAFSSTACIQVRPKGIAYVIEFEDNKQAISSSPASAADLNSNDLPVKPNAKSDHSAAVPETSSNLKSSSVNEQPLTLQEHLEKGKPKFLKHSKERKAILNQLQAMRRERFRQLREIIENTSMNSLDRRLQYLPPPPIQKIRILRTKEMKALTNKRFASLPEVVAKQEREIEEKKRRSNRLLRDVFNKRLQKRVRSGKLSLNHSKTVV